MSSNISSYIDNLQTTYLDSLNIVQKYKGDLLTSVEFNQTVRKVNELLDNVNIIGNSNIQNISDALRLLDEMSGSEAAIEELGNRIDARLDEIQNGLYGDRISISYGDSTSLADKLNQLENQLNNFSVTGEDISISSSDSTSLADKLNQLTSQLTSFDDTLSSYNNRINDLDSYTNILGSYIDTLDSYTHELGSYTHELGSYTNELGYTVSEIDERVRKNTQDIQESYTYLNNRINETDDKVRITYDGLYTLINNTTLTFDYDINSSEEEKQIYDNNNDLYDGSYHG